MPEYAACAIRYASTTPLGVAYDSITPDNTGAVASTQYWNHATEAFEAGPLDPAKHILPLTRLAVTGPYSNGYLLFMAKKPFGTENATAVVFNLDGAGLPTTIHDTYTQVQAKITAGMITC
jgi:hypothetical protein